jgi:hypothetical protein
MGEKQIYSNSNKTYSIENHKLYILLKLNTYEEVLTFNSQDYVLYQGQENFNFLWDTDRLKEIKIDWDWVPSLSKQGVYIKPKEALTPYRWHTLLKKINDSEAKNSSSDPSFEFVAQWQNQNIYKSSQSSFRVSVDQVHQIFENKCSCHQTYEEMNDWYTLEVAHFPLASQEYSGLSLLEMFEPSRSMLFLKILGDFPIQGEIMPPPPSKPLSTDELWVIERWILQGNKNIEF